MKYLIILAIFLQSCTVDQYERLFQDDIHQNIDLNFFEKGSKMSAATICYLKNGSKEVKMIPPTVNGSFEVEYDVTWTYERTDGSGAKTQQGITAIIKSNTAILCRMQAKRLGTNIKSDVFHCVVN